MTPKWIAFFVVAGSLLTHNAFAQSGKDGDAFKAAMVHFKAGQYELAATDFQNLLKEKSEFEEYEHFYLAQSYLKTGQTDKAETELKAILKLSPNAKMIIEVTNSLGQIAMDQKNFRQAQAQFKVLEKRTRGMESYPEVIYNLAVSEKGLSHKAPMCKALVKLYEHFPNYSKVQDWSLDLAVDNFEGKPSGCKVDTENFRTRVRYLLWAGLDEKAQAEINIMKGRLAKTDAYEADKLQVQFFLQEGEVVKALDLLKPYYEKNQKNFEYLILFASAAARAGEVQMAVGSYYSAYKLSPRSKTGRQALYQSAFLSYQFQDYDGAARRFQEFMKVYPRSGLNRDAQWHMAWLKYLKGDYQGSYKAFADMQMTKIRNRRAWKSFPSDRVTYWMAMSLYRQGKVPQAQNMMMALAKDPLLGYYAIAAQARLRKMASEKILSPLAKSNLPTRPHMIARFSASEFLFPSVEEDYRGEDSDSEENLILTQYSAEDEKGADEEETASSDTDNPDAKNVAVGEGDAVKDGDTVADNDGTGSDDEDAPAEEQKNNFSNPLMMKRFARAQALIGVGENEWARWDLFDIEKKTSKREYLRTLMNEYGAAGHYNRSAYIAQVTFGGQRASLGLDAGRSLWEKAYPEAYVSSVHTYTKQFDVPQELVWGIMRAESSYRRDAISPVGALGLMQVMPFTAHKVANMLGDKDFEAPLLLQPETSVKIGSRYLKRLMTGFDNTIPLVAAGYNAGPHRVKNWLASFGQLDTDEFIEHIPFLETRNYVKRVISNCYVYSKLYGNKKDLFPYLADGVPAKTAAENSVKENWDDI